MKHDWLLPGDVAEEGQFFLFLFSFFLTDLTQDPKLERRQPKNGPLYG